MLFNDGNRRAAQPNVGRGGGAAVHVHVEVRQAQRVPVPQFVADERAMLSAVFEDYAADEGGRAMIIQANENLQNENILPAQPVNYTIMTSFYEVQRMVLPMPFDYNYIYRILSITPPHLTCVSDYDAWRNSNTDDKMRQLLVLGILYRLGGHLIFLTYNQTASNICCYPHETDGIGPEAISVLLSLFQSKPKPGYKESIPALFYLHATKSIMDVCGQSVMNKHLMRRNWCNGYLRYPHSTIEVNPWSGWGNLVVQCPRVLAIVRYIVAWPQEWGITGCEPNMDLRPCIDLIGRNDANVVTWINTSLFDPTSVRLAQAALQMIRGRTNPILCYDGRNFSMMINQLWQPLQGANIPWVAPIPEWDFDFDLIRFGTVVSYDYNTRHLLAIRIKPSTVMGLEAINNLRLTGVEIRPNVGIHTNWIDTIRNRDVTPFIDLRDRMVQRSAKRSSVDDVANSNATKRPNLYRDNINNTNVADGTETRPSVIDVTGTTGKANDGAGSSGAATTKKNK